MRKQLNFFEAEIIPFPVYRRRREARQAAWELHTRSKEDGDRYWKRLIDEMARELKALGLSKTESHEQLMAFRDVVQDEIWNLQDSHSLRPGGGR